MLLHFRARKQIQLLCSCYMTLSIIDRKSRDCAFCSIALTDCDKFACTAFYCIIHC